MERQEWVTENDFWNMTSTILRNSVCGIDSSYCNFWDVLAELLQNSVDAIRKTDRKGKIEITINSPRRIISVKDNGCGIEQSDLVTLLKPFSTNKQNDPKTIGEKGVGLKFAYFQSNRFTIHTGTDEGSSYAELIDARAWKESTTTDLPLPNVYFSSEKYEGTEITLEDVKQDELFSLSYNQMKYILRTKTAVGNTSKIWNDKIEDIEVILDYIDSKGEQTKSVVENKYQLPTEVLPAKDIIDYDFFMNTWSKAEDRSDKEKRKKLEDKVIVKKFIDDSRNNRPIYVWACYVPNRQTWGKLSKASGLISQADYETYYNTKKTENVEWKREHSYVLMTSGIYTAVKGMPTTISIDPPEAGSSGYWQNMFFIVQDDGLNFDIGRKHINGKIATMYKNLVASQFKDIKNLVSKYVSGNSPMIVPDNFNIQKIVKEIEGLTNLNLKENSGVIFEKSPFEQEASVVAIFYELIGAGKITDVIPVISGYRSRYDLYARFNDIIVSIEFKSRLRNILDDFDDSTKIFSEINYIVCWEVTDVDEKALKEQNICLYSIDRDDSILDDNITYIQGCTHYMYIPNVHPVYVIDLKKMISK